RVHPSSTARKTSGNSCARIGYQTGSLNPSTISSTTAATPGTHSSINPGRSCPSRDATGQRSVTQSEDWYKSSARCHIVASHKPRATIASTPLHWAENYRYSNRLECETANRNRLLAE